MAGVQILWSSLVMQPPIPGTAYEDPQIIQGLHGHFSAENFAPIIVFPYTDMNQKPG